MNNQILSDYQSRKNFIKFPNCVLVFEELNIFTLLLCIVANLFLEVYYVKISYIFKKKIIINMLEATGIQILNNERATTYVMTQDILCKEIITNIFTQFFDKNATFNIFQLFFPNINNFTPKFKVCIKNYLNHNLKDSIELLVWGRSFQANHKKVFIFSTNLFIRQTTTISPYNFVNLVPYPFCFLICFLKIVNRIFLLFFQKIIRILMIKLKIRKENILKSAPSTKKKSLNYSDYEILFFPHQGVAYGNLFLKDHYYSDDPDNPFFCKKILHLEMSREDYLRTMNYYKKREIPFDLFPKTFTLIPFILPFISLLIKNYCPMIKDLNKNKIVGIAIIGLLYLRFSAYRKELARFSKARIALIGYDMLLPSILSMALESQKINTVATQERHYSPFLRNTSCLINYYLVSSSYIIKIIKNHHLYACDHLIPIGQIRLDLIYQYKRRVLEHKIAELKKKHHVVLALDFHSVENKIDNYSCLFHNWMSNKQFYNDLVKLAKSRPELYIIIRGKNDTWCNLSEFKDIYRIICETPNIEINRNYSEFNVSYKLAASVDTIIARQTSLVAEALAGGIPTLIMDYYPNSKKIISSNINYCECPVFVNSYEELKQRMEQLSLNNYYMPEKQFNQMRQEVFGNYYDGKVKERLHEYLMKIYLTTDIEQTYIGKI